MTRTRSGSHWARLACVATALTVLATARASDAAPPVDSVFNHGSLFRAVFAADEPRPATPRAWASLFASGPDDPGRGSPLQAQAGAQAEGAAPPAPQAAAYGSPSASSSQPSITWGPLIGQSFGFLTAQHIWRATFEENTWKDTVEGSFWDDYFTSVSNFCCWDDGDKFSTNYIFHPALGAVASFIFANNHRASKTTPPAATGAYWGAKAKQGIFAFAYSAYFELGLVLSEAAIGNVGLDGHGMTWEDLVVTPSVGMMWSAGEDALRSTVIDRIDRWNHGWGVAAALLLNPTRSVANLFAIKKPWADPPWLTLRREERIREQARSQAPPQHAIRAQ